MIASRPNKDGQPSLDVDFTEKVCAVETNHVQSDVYGMLNLMMCLVRKKINVPKVELRFRTPSRNNRVSQHDTSSSQEFVSGASSTSQQSRESTPRHSNKSNASFSSLSTLREVVGDGAILFSYKELCRATDNFSDAKKIGGSVYRGTLKGRQEVAVTVQKKGETFTDLVGELQNLCRVHHGNVVTMIGACSSKSTDNVYIVYEYVEGGASLKSCLRNDYAPGFSVLSSWTSRLRVALDVAKGLEYLHEHTCARFVHKYVKSSNIMLEGDTLRAKIANFGMAHIMGEVPPEPPKVDPTRILSTDSEILEVSEEEAVPMATLKLVRTRSKKLTGTRGYIAPEYIATGVVSPKLDVFAFGVVMLELLSGQEPVTYRFDEANNTMKKTVLLDSLKSIGEDPEPKNRLRAWVDPLLKDSYPLQQAWKFSLVAKSCVDPNPDYRPDMRSVALDLTRIMMASEKWEASLLSSKQLMSRTIEAR